MFEERRKGGSGPPVINGSGGGRNGTLAGIDKSYPLDPIHPSKGLNNNSSRTPSSKSLDPPAPLRATVPVATMKPLNLGTSNKPLREPPPKKEPVTSNVSPKRVTPAPVVRSRVTPSPRATPTPTPTTALSPTSPVPAEDSYLPPPPANTTKYSDYATELERREASLSNKLKGLDLNKDGNSSRGPSKPNSPTRRAPPTPTAVSSCFIIVISAKLPPFRGYEFVYFFSRKHQLQQNPSLQRNRNPEVHHLDSMNARCADATLPPTGSGSMSPFARRWPRLRNGKCLTPPRCACREPRLSLIFASFLQRKLHHLVPSPLPLLRYDFKH
jgi:hypothetical protein